MLIFLIFRIPLSAPLIKAKARLIAAQRAYERERLSLTPEKEDLRDRLTKSRSGQGKVPSSNSGGGRFPTATLHKQYLRSQARAREHRERLAKASAEAKAVAPEEAGPSSAVRHVLVPHMAPEDYIASEERRLAEAVHNENRRLREEVRLLKDCILSAGLSIPPGVRGNGKIQNLGVSASCIHLAQTRGAGCRATAWGIPSVLSQGTNWLGFPTPCHEGRGTPPRKLMLFPLCF